MFNRIAVSLFCVCLLAGVLSAQPITAGIDYPAPYPVPFVGYTVSTSDPALCAPGLSPINFRSDLAQYKFCSTRNVWSIINGSNAAVTGTTGSFSSTLSVAGPTTLTGGAVQSTVTSPFTAFTTYVAPGNLIAPTTVTDTVGEYWSQIFIPTNATLTGACLLNGSTVTTDKHIVFLANAAGTIIAHSNLTSVADSGASQYQCQAFTATIAVTGPQAYFVGTQPNGTTDTFSAYATGGAPTNYGTGLTTAATFGTLVNITPTVTFTTAEGPLMSVY
jgi:hypothetical protein